MLKLVQITVAVRHRSQMKKQTATNSHLILSCCQLHAAGKSIKSSAADSDDINSSATSICIPSSLPALFDIVNFSLRTGVFPTACKMRIVCPLPKYDRPNSYKDLRLIIILRYLSKNILEKIFFNSSLHT